MFLTLQSPDGCDPFVLETLYNSIATHAGHYMILVVQRDADSRNLCR